jgi:nitrogen fixation NifU-like protein
MHCSNLAADALKDAINKYREKQHPAGTRGAAAAAEHETTGMEQYAGRGVYEEARDPTQFAEKRVMVVEHGERSFEIARDLIKHTPRVILITRQKETGAAPVFGELTRAGVKILYESELLEIRGFKTVEKVLVHDMNEDDEYELFIDSVIMLRDDKKER